MQTQLGLLRYQPMKSLERIRTRSARIEIAYVLATTIVCQWLVYQIPLWSMRIRGWQLQLVALHFHFR